MKRISLFGVLALGASLSGAAAGPSWMKLDQALRYASATGKPICIYVAVNPNGSS